MDDSDHRLAARPRIAVRDLHGNFFVIAEQHRRIVFRTPWFDGWFGLSASALKRQICSSMRCYRGQCVTAEPWRATPALTGAPDESGAKRREQGFAKAGNARVRRG